MQTPPPRTDSHAIGEVCLNELLDATPVPYVLVGAINSSVRAVWANRAFYSLTGRSVPVAGLGLSECKITLRRKDPISGAIERWSPLRAISRERVAAASEGAFGRTRRIVHDTWTCDVETAFGQWHLSQAVISSVPAHAVSEEVRSIMSAVPLASGGAATARTPLYWAIQILPRAEPGQAQELIESMAAPALDALADISSLLVNVEHPRLLSSIAEILVEATPAIWTGFFIGRDELLYTEGISPQNIRRPSAHSTFVAPLPESSDIYSLLVQRARVSTSFDMDAVYPERTAEALIQDRVREQWEPEGFTGGGLVMVHVIAGRETVYGLMVSCFPQLNDLDEPFVAEDIPRESQKVFNTVAIRVGMVTENAQLFEREHQLAQTLQKSMLPTQDVVEELDIWTFYAPSSDHARVGGDWFDISYVREQAIGIVVGDVVGHDIEAAAAMGQLRLITRSYGFECHNAVEVLERVDNLVEGLEVPHQASLVYARLTPPEMGELEWQMEYIRAGHLPPILIREGKASLLSDANGSLIGFRKRARISAYQQLLPGDIVVLYTDGLIERRDRPMQVGLQRLVEVVSEGLYRSARALGEMLLSKLADAPEDDVALVVLRVPIAGELEPGTEPYKRTRVAFASEPASVGLARRIFEQVCREWGHKPQPSAELVLSELVSNAVMHGWGQIILRLTEASDCIRIEVEDRNPSGPRRLDGHEERPGGYGIKIVDRLSTWGWEEKGAGKIVWAHVPFEEGPLSQL